MKDEEEINEENDESEEDDRNKLMIISNQKTQRRKVSFKKQNKDLVKPRNTTKDSFLNNLDI